MNRVMGLNNSISNPYAAMMNRKQPKSAMHKTEDVRVKLRQLTQNRQSVYDGFSQSGRGNLLINSTLDYGRTIREQRKQTKDSLIQLKSVKYQFKNISSQILRAKTSTSARQVVGQAEREVLRLKRERMKEGVDETEIDAAITHAKAMERVARRKVKHLLQEEMAEASGKKETMVTEEEIGNTDDVKDNKDNEGNIDKITDDAEPVEDLLEDMSREMQELLEDTGLEELNDALEAETGDMEPEDIKMLKIKHRNKEMKDIVKADSEYLKAVFDHLEEQKADMTPTSMSSMSMPMEDMGISVEPSIDIAL